jgi:hypothetical protein
MDEDLFRDVRKLSKADINSNDSISYQHRRCINARF